MTLEELKDYWQQLSLKHKDVLQFSVGSWYDSATNTDDKYPLVWWELPYNLNYSQEFSNGKDTINVSLSVFINTKLDDVADSHQAISLSKEIGDAIISKARLEATQFKIQSVNAVTVREYSDDYVAGLRYDMVLLMQRSICENDLNEYFN